MLICNWLVGMKVISYKIGYWLVYEIKKSCIFKSNFFKNLILNYDL